MGDSQVAEVDPYRWPGIGFSWVPGVRGFTESIVTSMKGEVLHGKIA